jgi:nitrate/nitrite transporter NarK
MARDKKTSSILWHVFIIILAGELIFTLPFHIARFFRPTFLQAFELTNAQLGDIFAVYGVVAMLAYFPGGIIADKFAPNRLMSLSLLATALGGVYLWSGPDKLGLSLLFGYWGATTILLFWAAMIKATRLSADSGQQGLAFGLLDGGRGLVASLLASGAVLLLSFTALSVDGNFDSKTQALAALRYLIGYYSLLTALTAILAWFGIRQDTSSNLPADASTSTITAASLKASLSNPLIWLQGGVVVCAYCGYKSLDNYGLFMMQAFNWSQIEAAQFTTVGSYLRPIAAVTAGLLADRIRASRLTLSLFLLLGMAFMAIGVLIDMDIQALWMSITLLLTFAGVFALRAIYFALVDESQLRLGATGTAVGVISLLGFTPDIFFALITGRMLDANDNGFANYFLFMAFIMTIGCLCAWRLIWKINSTSPIGKTQSTD